MRKRREKNGSLVHQVEKQFLEMMTPGRSKHADKLANDTYNKIYSFGTLQNYMDKSVRFVKWVKKEHPDCKDLEDCKRYIAEYIDSLKHYSNTSKKTIRSALRKLYQEEIDVEIGKCCRADIKRSRRESVSDKHFSEKNNWELVDFCRGTGLRNKKELQTLRGNMLRKKGDDYWLIGVVGKNGKIRNVKILPEYAVTVVRLCQAAGDAKVWPHVHSCADVHSYRADYAHLWYNRLARPIEDIPKNERYICRKEKAGIIYDKRAMLTVSRYLGHNRIDVMADHYLWKTEEEMSKICPMSSENII